ncbi:MAG: M1 family metallopeptidase [Acidobacteria bacterium]|nr:M1 family metallopeptidase [Acidobacteriota bacterium]
MARASVHLSIATFIFTLAAGVAPVHGQRLPTTAMPTHYDLKVAPDLAAATFSGEETVKIMLSAATDRIVLNAAEIEFQEVTVTAGGRVQKAVVTLDANKEQATFKVPSAIPVGPAEIRIKYTGILNDQLRGLYLSKANNRRYAVTQLEATDARRMFPSFDEPAFKATFALTAVIDTGDHAISNGGVVSDTPGPAGKHTVTFETTPKMSTYLVALAVGDFECTAGSADGIPVRICSTPDKKALTGFALESALEIMKYLNGYYSVKYPFKKLDVVAVPDFAAGAMENTAAIFYRETFLLADPKNASVQVRKQIAEVLAHEIAHQWFGDLVTMQWWDDIWLNEGFANWMQTKPIAAWKPDWQMELDEVQANQAAMGLDALRSTRPIRARASTPAEINELFDPIAYEKGAAVLRMVESWVGAEAFRTGVNAYIEGFKYGNARAEDFWATLTKSTGKPVDRVMSTFVDQPGVPLVEATVTCGASGTTVTLTQERYVRDAPQRAAPAQVWHIPVCLRTSSGKFTCELLTKKSTTVTLDACPVWIMSNARGSGYYRAAYPDEVLKKLAADVGTLSPTERIAVLSDEWALVRACRDGVGEYLDLASGFRGERAEAVMATLTGTLDTIGEYVARGAARPAYRAWLAGLLRPALQGVGWDGRPAEPDDRRALRANVIASLGETARDAEVLAKAREVIRQELAKPGAVEPTLLTVVVHLAAIEGDAALYDQYLARSQAATDPEERYRYLYGLTSFTDPALLKRTMDLALGPDVRSQDTKLVIARMLGNSEGRDLAWDLLRARWDDVQKKTGEFVGNTVIVGALSNFCDLGKAAEIRSFFATHKVPDAERTLQQTIERVESCARLADAQDDRLAEWLKRGSNGSTTR